MSILGKSLTSSNSGLTPEIIVTAPAGSTLTCGTQTYTLGASETSYTFKVVFGTHTVTASLGSDSASKTITVNEVIQYKVELTYVYGTINVTTEKTAYVTATKDGVTIEGTWDSSTQKWVIEVSSLGTWTVTAVYNGKTLSTTASISSKGKVKNVSLEFTVVLLSTTFDPTTSPYWKSKYDPTWTSGSGMRMGSGDRFFYNITSSDFSEIVFKITMSSLSSGIEINATSNGDIVKTATAQGTFSFIPKSAGYIGFWNEGDATVWIGYVAGIK